MRIDRDVKDTLAQCEALEGVTGGIPLLCKKIRAAIRAGDPNEAARFGLLLGRLRGGLESSPFVVKEVKRFLRARQAQGDKREGKRAAVLEAYGALTADEKAPGKMAVYRRIAKELGCKIDTVRKYLRDGEIGTD